MTLNRFGGENRDNLGAERAELDGSSYGSYNESMKAVGIKVLKNKLSEYLRMVQGGEVVLVTDRGEVVAEIRQPTVAAGGVSRWRAFVNEQVRRGVMLPATRSSVALPELLADNPLPVRIADEDFRAAYEECRSDRL